MVGHSRKPARESSLTSARVGRADPRRLLVALVGALLLGVLLGPAVGVAAAQPEPTSRPIRGIGITTVTLASGAGATTTGVDSKTSLCEKPTTPAGAPPVASVKGPDPVSPGCAKGTPAHPYLEPHGPWSGAIPGAKWVGIDPTGHGSDFPNSSPTFYIYDAEFTLGCTGHDSLVGHMLADNAAGVFLNNHLITAQPDPSTPPSKNFTTPTFFVTSFNFHAGLNVVDFIVHDTSPPATGLDYSFTVISPRCATLKICKVAGLGVPVLTPFTFMAGSATVSVPAGPAPGGYCKVVGSKPVGATGTIKEVIPPGDQVTGIAVVPAANQVGPANLVAGKVRVTLGPGVTEVTYTDQGPQAAKSGYLEVCKQVVPSGIVVPAVWHFSVDGQPVTVPTGACSPPVQVPAGSATVTETSTPPWFISACSTIPPPALISCGPLSVTVTVAPGGVANETILTVTDSAQ